MASFEYYTNTPKGRRETDGNKNGFQTTSSLKLCVYDMLTVDDQGFERFWGPSAIKPLNFNYEFQPTFVGQNIWTLTDNLFVPNYKRGQAEEADDDFMKVVYSKSRNVGRDAQKKSSRYKQFPTIDHDIHQKSSSAQGSYISRKLKIVGSPLSSSSQQSPRTSPKPVPVARKVTKPEATSGILKPQVQSSTTKFVGKKQPASTPKFTLKKRPQQSGLTLKLSQQETERLLKSLDFKVRTVRKPKLVRDRSKSEALGREKVHAKIVGQKQLSNSKVESNKPRLIKNIDPKTTNLENQGLLKSSKMSSSSEKNSRSSSGLNELVGPLPKVNWTHSDSIQQQKSSSSSLKKKSSEKSGVSVGKGSKTSTNSKKLKNNPCGSQDISQEPSTEENTVSQQKVKTTRVKIIPKITLNNQLLKSTTLKTESKPTAEKKTVTKAPPKKKDPKAKTDSILWTPERIALLDQITNDQQLKAVLMSAGDTYMKSRKYFAVKSNVKTKPPTKQASSVMKKESTDTKKINNTVATARTLGVTTAKKTNKQGNVDIPKPVSKEEESMGSDTLDLSIATLASKNEATRSPEANVQSVKKAGQKKVTNSQLLKTGGVPKTAKTPKSPARKLTNSLAQKDYKVASDVAANKKRPNYAINSRQVRKVEERLAQLSAEVSGNPRQIQDKKVSQAQRTNLDHLRKIIDKSLTKFKEDNKAGEIKSD